MKLTTKGRYAVMAMADIAVNQKLKPVSLKDISLRQNISLSNLEQLFSKLKNRQLVKSVRGPLGGYILDTLFLTTRTSAVYANSSSQQL